MGKAPPPECRGSRVPGQKLTKKIIFPLQRVKLLTDLQMLGCELHKNAFGGRAPPRPAGAAIALPRLPGRYRGKEREGGKERFRSRDGRKGREGRLSLADKESHIQ